jgi:hypothetical protein
MIMQQPEKKPIGANTNLLSAIIMVMIFLLIPLIVSLTSKPREDAPDYNSYVKPQGMKFD